MTHMDAVVIERAERGHPLSAQHLSPESWNPRDVARFVLRLVLLSGGSATARDDAERILPNWPAELDWDVANTIEPGAPIYALHVAVKAPSMRWDAARVAIGFGLAPAVADVMVDLHQAVGEVDPAVIVDPEKRAVHVAAQARLAAVTDAVEAAVRRRIGDAAS